MSTAAGKRVRAGVARWVVRWWAGQGGVAGAALHQLLLPAEWTYRGIVASRSEAYDRGWLPVDFAPLPVVSVGNLSVGGAGKTPFSAWIGTRLALLGCRPALVLRGYGDDEVLVHQELNPELGVFTAAERLQGVEAAAHAGHDVAVLDDAFQHRRLARDLDLLLISADSWHGAHHLLPRGPWRESLRAARRADLLVVTRKSVDAAIAAEVASQLARIVPERSIVTCRLEPIELAALHGSERCAPHGLAGRSVFAVSGLASPEPFVANLRALGAEVEHAGFPDHHPYTAAEARLLQRRAGDRIVVTTLKDAVKLRLLWKPGFPVYVLRQGVALETGAEHLERALERFTPAAAA
jgi:tetraacyldisaccharide 4'-kinase